MSFWNEKELAELDYVEITTTLGSAPLTVRSPGICTITGDGVPREWQVRKGFGLSGATQAFTGLGLADFDIVLRLVTAKDRELFALFDAACEPSQPGAPERVYRIKNPRLSIRGIVNMVFLNAPILRDMADGSETATYHCRQHRKPLPTLTSPSAAGEATAGGTQLSKFQDQMAERLAVIRNLNRALK